MSNTSNFDYCVQFSLPSLKAIFHLALKNEELFPHNLPPITQMFGAHPATIHVRLLDDETDPADVSIDDEKHLRFSLPIEITVEIPSAPDPALSRITLTSTVTVPGKHATWPVGGDDQLGIDFGDITAADVQVPALAGLPTLTSDSFLAAIHTKFEALPSRSFTQFGNTLNIYDGTRGPPLTPPNKPGHPEITAVQEDHGPDAFLKMTLPLHATITNPISWQSYGLATFWRKVVTADSTVSILMDQEPGGSALATQIAFDSGGPIATQVASQLKPLLISQLASFSPIIEPWFGQAEAEALMKEQTAAYLQPRRFPFYTPRSGDPDLPLATPVGFLLPADDVLAILLNRRTGTAADDVAPDAFIGAHQLALAVGRAKLDEVIAKAVEDQFPGLAGGSAEVHTDEGDATLHSLTVTPSDPGAHGVGEGHLWAAGEAEVHIDCWFDPDVSFDGAIFLRLDVVETEAECTGTFRAEMGDFDAGQSCCDVFVDLLIPIVGWIMLGVIEGMIDKVGGELAEATADSQARAMQPIPPFVAGVAELQACLEECLVSSQGLVLPGKMRIRREGTSFEDLSASGDLPRP